MTDPKILYFDIETSIAIFAGYHLGKQHVNHTQVLKRPQVMCISWAWGDGKIQHKNFDLGKFDLSAKDDDADYELLKYFTEKVMSQADLWITHNGEEFDTPTITSRLVKYKLPPLPQTLSDDTYKQSKKKIRYFSHKLDDIGDYLGYGNKEDHGRGMDWWIRIAQGDRKLLKEMVVYCDGDVDRLRKIYKHQLPYVKSSLNRSAWEQTLCCTQCSSTNLVKDGFRRTMVGKFQKYRCADCGHPFHGGENLNKQTKKFGRSV